MGRCLDIWWAIMWLWLDHILHNFWAFVFSNRCYVWLLVPSCFVRHPSHVRAFLMCTQIMLNKACYSPNNKSYITTFLVPNSSPHTLRFQARLVQSLHDGFGGCLVQADWVACWVDSCRSLGA
eukprot:2803940-Amphidinium_carterae.1